MGSRPTLQVVLATWLARSSVTMGFLVVELVRPLGSLKCSPYQLERLFYCYCICIPWGRTRRSHHVVDKIFAGPALSTFRAWKRLFEVPYAMIAYGTSASGDYS